MQNELIPCLVFGITSKLWPGGQDSSVLLQATFHSAVITNQPLQVLSPSALFTIILNTRSRPKQRLDQLKYADTSAYEVYA